MGRLARGRLVFDPSKPDGAPRKLQDVSRVTALGWSPRYGLGDGMRQAYRWFCEHQNDVLRA